MNPKVSIIIPTFRRPTMLKRAISSLSIQTYNNIEVVIVDDDPDSDIEKCINQYNIEIKYYQNGRNRGAPYSRNKGLQKASGKYVSFLDDDDELLPSKIELQVNAFENSGGDCGLVYTHGFVIQGDSRMSIRTPNQEGYIYKQLLRNNFILSPSPLLRKQDVIDIGGFDEKLDSSQDLDLWLRMTRNYTSKVISKPLVICRKEHNNRISEDIDNKYNGTLRLYDKYKDDIDEDVEAFENIYNKLGNYSWSLGKNEEANYYFAELGSRRSRLKHVIQYYITTLPYPIPRICLLVKSRITKSFIH